MAEISKKTDLKLKLLALDIASREMIENTGSLDLDKLFDQARLIYDKAVDNGIYDWESPYAKKVEKPEEKPEEPEEQKTIVEKVPEGLKQCPKCGELIPEAWKVHKFKKDGTVCGHVF